MESMEEKEEKQSLLPAGFRFFPTDEELVTYYLARKAMDASFTSSTIRDVDLYTSDPWDLIPCNNSSVASTGGGGGGDGAEGGECYFFCVRSSKYPSGPRARRATAGGYWKSTGKDKGVYGGGGGLVGTKKTLVLYGGRAPRGEKTRWVMHEYSRANNNILRGAQSEWVICRMFMKKPPSDHYYNMLEVEQEVETTTSQEHMPTNRRHLLPAEAPMSAPPPSSRRSGSGRAAMEYGDREEDDGHGKAREGCPVVSSSRCTSPSFWLLNNDQLHMTHRHDHLDASSSDDLPELMDFGEIYSGITGGGTTDHRADQLQASSSNSGCSFLDEPYCWNF